MSLEFKKKWVQNFASDIDDIFINENTCHTNPPSYTFSLINISSISEAKF